MTSLDSDSTTELLVMMDEWLEEASRMEREAKEETLDEILARLMFTLDVPLMIKQQEAAWDASGDGTITKGEFRNHIRALGLTETPVEEIDALFCRWDTDDSGTIDMDELTAALKQLRVEFVRKYGKNGWKFTVAEQVANLRKRAQDGRDAITAAEKAEAVAADLVAKKAALDNSIEVQLGSVLTKRRVNVGEIVGTWAKSKAPSGKRELSKKDFKDEVERLGLVTGGHPVTRKQLGALFESVDDDNSGFLDLNEAKAALKKWQANAVEATLEKERCDRKMLRLRNLAAKKLAAALRPPDAPPPASPDSPTGADSVEEASPVGGIAHVLTPTGTKALW